jgi:hypothetical protein
MTSFQRQLQRAARRRAGLSLENHREQPSHLQGDGYLVLHPTRGWKRVSYLRARAQQKLAQLLDRVVARYRKNAKRSTSAAINRHTGKPHTATREKAKQRGKHCRKVEGA